MKPKESCNLEYEEKVNPEGLKQPSIKCLSSHEVEILLQNTNNTKTSYLLDIDGKQNDNEKSDNLKMNRESDGNKQSKAFKMTDNIYPRGKNKKLSKLSYSVEIKTEVADGLENQKSTGKIDESKKFSHCNICQKNFTKKYLKRHKDSVHNEKKPFGCSICPSRFVSKGDMNRHVAVVHEKKKPFQCSLCQKNFSKNPDLNRHVATVHEGKKPFTCDICSKSFAERKTLKTHIKVVHEGQKRFKCNVCYNNFTQKQHLLGHIAAVHEGKRPYNCNICHISLASNQSVKRHISSVHEGKKPFTCDACSRCFAEMNKLKEHVEFVHEGKKTFKCELCINSFNNKINLRSPVSCIHEGKRPFQCNTWDATFTSNFTLMTHVAAVHEVKKPFQCDKCSKRFSLKSKLNEHIASVHEGKKQCNSCDANFTRKGSLVRHVATVHEGKKPYKCSICHTGFSQKQHVMSHLKKVHQENKIKNWKEFEYIKVEEIDLEDLVLTAMEDTNVKVELSSPDIKTEKVNQMDVVENSNCFRSEKTPNASNKSDRSTLAEIKTHESKENIVRNIETVHEGKKVQDHEPQKYSYETKTYKMEVSSEIKQEEMSEVIKQEVLNEQIASNNAPDKNININDVQERKMMKESFDTKREEISDNTEMPDEINVENKSNNESMEVATEEIKNEAGTTDNEADMILGI